MLIDANEFWDQKDFGLIHNLTETYSLQHTRPKRSWTNIHKKEEEKITTQEEAAGLRHHGQGGGAVEAAAASRALIEVGDGEGGGEGTDVEADIGVVPHHLVDAEPGEQDLDAHPLQVRQRSRLYLPGDLPAVLEYVPSLHLELAIPAEVHLEAPIPVQYVALHALGEDSLGEFELLEHLVGGGSLGNRSLEGERGDEEEEETRSNFEDRHCRQEGFGDG